MFTLIEASRIVHKWKKSEILNLNLACKHTAFWKLCKLLVNDKIFWLWVFQFACLHIYYITASRRERARIRICWFNLRLHRPWGMRGLLLAVVANFGKWNLDFRAGRIQSAPISTWAQVSDPPLNSKRVDSRELLSWRVRIIRMRVHTWREPFS